MSEQSKRPTVFVVDDDKAMRESLAMLVKLWDLPVESFASAHEFLEKYDATRRGCLVVDVCMPGMSGIELHAKLVRDGVHLPTIFISGQKTPELTAETRRRGVVTAFQKPFPPEEFLEAIGRVIKEQNSR